MRQDKSGKVGYRGDVRMAVELKHHTRETQKARLFARGKPGKPVFFGDNAEFSQKFLIGECVCDIYSIHIGLPCHFSPRRINSTEISAGLTPLIRDACPSVIGRMAESFCIASMRSPLTSV